ncbi:hypothetical protein DFJ58DRAFT_726268 [Suillus subalutaceus]|uniref:uncharacterized protein n=1 Tax=Suillus subalutaceus TaxID=48586 RepID=UPI001B867D8A|nr:uncharacterized protein DFJ58DRAFT_726268 [Suillus subalutaceus]KAG1859548.1 hypothetical protein DFJ58DRAFT_726268 [Suillus subalutaceus]
MVTAILGKKNVTADENCDMEGEQPDEEQEMDFGEFGGDNQYWADGGSMDENGMHSDDDEIDNDEISNAQLELWKHDSLNLEATDPASESIDILQLHKDDTYNKKIDGSKCSAHLEAFTWHIRRILVEDSGLFDHYRERLGSPDVVLQIPLQKTNQIPCQVMKIKQSTTDGNMEVMENLLKQGGIGDPKDDSFDPVHDVDMSEYVLFIHDDLLTKEQLDTVRRLQQIENTPKNRFQYLISLPSLFHYKMACADAIWRTYIQPKDSRGDHNSLYEHIGCLQPKDALKFISKPGFRRMHEVIHHDLTILMLDCWRVKVKKKNGQITTLELFASSQPTWDELIQMSYNIVVNYMVAGSNLRQACSKAVDERDKQFENQILRNCDELLYVDLCQAMNSGDICCVEASFLPWIDIFAAVGKHKYAAQIAKFTSDL